VINQQHLEQDVKAGKLNAMRHLNTSATPTLVRIEIALYTLAEAVLLVAQTIEDKPE
jgi:hypothetical protein